MLLVLKSTLVKAYMNQIKVEGRGQIFEIYLSSFTVHIFSYKHYHFDGLFLFLEKIYFLFRKIQNKKENANMNYDFT